MESIGRNRDRLAQHKRLAVWRLDMSQYAGRVADGRDRLAGGDRVLDQAD
jgi:hypothetical protein